MVEEEEECEDCHDKLLYSPTDDDYRHLSFMDKPRKDYIAEDFIEAIVYDLHQINTFSENAINLLNELFGRVYDK